MSSNINPDNINGAYPVAGQDNNSQGFRDNFTNIKTNFQYAEDEINDLQTNVVVKAALSGGTVDNNMNNNTIYAVNLNDVSTTRTALSGTSGTITVDYTTGQYQTIASTAGSVTLAFTNWPASGYYGSVRVSVTISNTSYTLTLPAAVSANNQGIKGLNPSTNVITFAAAGTYVFDFATSNGGSSITVNEVNKVLQPFNNSSEDLANAGAANLSLTTSYFTTGAAETATLAAGVEGQIKVFSAVDVTSGNMVITVTNAGWKASGTGTITFGSRGVGCTLQYTNSKWYCIGNNGCVFG